jgi:hypothetical protein
MIVPFFSATASETEPPCPAAAVRTTRSTARRTLPGTSNDPTEAINGRLEHLRGSALGFGNLTNYIARSLLETSEFRPRLHPALVKSRSYWAVGQRYDGGVCVEAERPSGFP